MPAGAATGRTGSYTGRAICFALHLVGYRDLALYDASWEEWGMDSTLPIERGDG